MNREIKFRGQKISTKEWVYGSLVSDTQNKLQCICQQMPNPVSNGIINGWCFGVVNVGQFTGLKDKNGVDIYEGDIVRCGTVAPIVFIDGRFIYNYEHPEDPEELDVLEVVSGEVIGNIHENK